MTEQHHLIFLVEDDPTQAKLFEHILLKRGYRCVVSGSGQEAAKKALQMTSQKQIPDLLLLDFHLPDQNGFELLDLLHQEQPSWCEIPCVFLTAVSDPTVVAQAYQQGANDFLTKPVSPELLFAKLRAILRRTAPVSRTPSSPDNLQPGTILDGRYEILSRLGEGGMAVVYHVMDQRWKQDMALKILTPTLSSQSIANEERFRREIEAQQELEHPHLIRVFDVGVQPPLLYYTMEYLPGGSLLQRIQKGPIPAHQAVPIAAKLASLLDFIHSHNILHRDIKTENILFSKEGEPVLTDFGLALRLRSGERRLTQQDLVVGTPCYMSPERITNDDSVDHRSDVYALGMLMYEMLAGYLPHSELDLLAIYKFVQQGLIPPSELNSSAPASVSDICMKAIAFEPEHRYQTAGEMARALEDVLLREFGDKLP